MSQETQTPFPRRDLNKWLPLLAALGGILTQTFYMGNRLGAAENKIENLEHLRSSTVSSEIYTQSQSSIQRQLSDIKDSQRDLSIKLDRFIEGHRIP